MVWKNLARIAAAGAEAVGRAFARAIREELNAQREMAARQAAAGPSSNTSSKQSQRAEQQKAMEMNAKLGISLQEAIQILDVKQPLDGQEIRRRYDHLFAVNDKSKGGTIYLQAKIYRAKERLDAELERLEKERIEKEEKAGETKGE